MAEIRPARTLTAIFADKVRLGFVASPAPEAQAALKRLTKRYGAAVLPR